MVRILFWTSRICGWFGKSTYFKSGLQFSFSRWQQLIDQHTNWRTNYKMDSFVRRIHAGVVKNQIMIWFEMIWFYTRFRHSNHRFRRNQRHRWKELAESFRPVQYLPRKPWVYPLHDLVLVVHEIQIWNWNQIMIWSDLFWIRFWASRFDLIWRLSQFPWFDLICGLFSRGLIWRDLICAHLWIHDTSVYRFGVSFWSGLWSHS